MTPKSKRCWCKLRRIPIAADACPNCGFNPDAVPASERRTNHFFKEQSTSGGPTVKTWAVRK